MNNKTNSISFKEELVATVMLTAKGISYDIQQVSLGSIAWLDTELQTREDVAIANPKLVLEYAEIIGNGEFPMPVLQLRHDKRLAIVCGNHRCAALKSLEYSGTFPAVVVGPAVDRNELKLISALENNTHGARMGNSEKVSACARVLVDSPMENGAREHHNSFITELADRYKCPASSLRTKYRSILMCRQLRLDGVEDALELVESQASLFSALWRKDLCVENIKLRASVVNAIRAGAEGATLIKEIAKKRSIADLIVSIDLLTSQKQSKNKPIFVNRATLMDVFVQSLKALSKDITQIPKLGVAEPNQVAQATLLFKELSHAFKEWENS
jgi:hypothetical protein